MSLRALEAFVATVDCANITRAAEQLGLTQPAVSLAMQELELAIGKPLIDRSMRPLCATRAGVELYKRAVQLLAEVDRMLVAVTSVSGDTMPSMRLGAAGSMMGSNWIFELQSLVEELHVLGGLSLDLQKSLLARKIDAAVLGDTPMYEHPGIERRQLLEEPFLLVLPVSHEKQLGNASLGAIAERLPLIRYSSRTTVGAAVDVYLRRCSLDLPRRLEFETSNTVLEMVQGGLGWTIATPLCIAESRVDLSTIAIKPLQVSPAPRRVHLLNFVGELPIADRVRDILADSLKELITKSLTGANEWILKQVSFDEPHAMANATTAVLTAPPARRAGATARVASGKSYRRR
ncbi:MAG TPA: LysR family transcriptional regulator [Ramlibacter sp.]|nr:LysR family transcriptional regulator [Ramlibacter sp.]